LFDGALGVSKLSPRVLKYVTHVSIKMQSGF
jgi:hypothetical protein